MSLSSDDFKVLTELVKKESGIFLTEDKEYLLEGRLTPIAKKHNLPSLSALAAHIKQKPNAKLTEEIVEAMTTNESFFFRDIKPFDNLKKFVIPELKKMTPGLSKLRIWCAACSTGQEPYSIAMSLMEEPACAGINFEILATDIDQTVLDRAIKASYTQFEVQRGMPINLLIKYFTQDNQQWLLKEDVKKKVRFQKFNLMGVPAFGKFDIIFCRNVLIYFDDETKKKVLHNLKNSLQTHSFLFLGASESMVGMDTGMKPVPESAGLFIHK